MNRNCFLKNYRRIFTSMGRFMTSQCRYLYASYNGSQLGFTTRNTTDLGQAAYCTTNKDTSGIAVDSGNNIYLAARNHLHKYSTACVLQVDMTFPDPAINYTGVYVKYSKPRHRPRMSL